VPRTRITPFSYGFRESDIEQITAEIGSLLRDRRHLTMGANGAALEHDFAAYAGRRHVVSVASGTAALEIILRAVDVAGAQVIVPTNTFGATVVAVLRAGGVPVFADTADDMSVSLPDVAGKLSAQVRAVITVHIGGTISAQVRELAELCAGAGVALVEDAAHAAGAVHDGQQPGSFGIAAAFSLFSTKVMTSGEGGLIATDDDRIRDHAVLLRDHAKNPDGTMSTTGYNWRLTELQAIVARAQLRRLDAMIASRNEVAARYDERLRQLDGVRLLSLPPDSRRNGYKYLVFTERVRPEEAQNRLANDYGIVLGGYVYQHPCHRQPAFYEFAAGSFRGADRLCSTHLCPPIHPDMALADVDYVADALHDVLAGAPRRVRWRP
jgi:dTDP-4-amino-4,6-dideoxygalactose transaminase